MELFVAIICLACGWVLGAKQMFDYHKKKVKEGMKPHIGKTGDMEWTDI